MLPMLKPQKQQQYHKSSDLKYLETIASAPSSPSSSPPTSQNHQQQQPVYVKWSQNLDHLVNDELGRKIFIEYLSETQNESLLMLHVIFRCLLQCSKEEQIKTILKAIHNQYFKNNENSTKKKLAKLFSNKQLIDSLCKSLEQNHYDEVLMRNVTEELRTCLEKTFYLKFIKTKFYQNVIQILQKQEDILSGLNLDEQFKFIIDAVSAKDDVAVKDFLKPHIPEHEKQTKSKSKSKLNDSLTSKKSFDLKGKKSKIPPNPYHSSNTVLLVSAQDSEIQSLASDLQVDDEVSDKMKAKHQSKKSELDDKLNSSTVTNVSLKSLHKLAQSRKQPTSYEKSYDEMKDQAKLNENVDHNMPFIQIPRTEQIIATKKNSLPLAESDPKKFAQILVEKLEKVIEKAEKKNLINEMNNLSLEKAAKITTTTTTNELYISKQQQQHHQLQDSDNEAERMIDEHVNRVFKTTVVTTSVPDLHKPQSPPKQQHHHLKNLASKHNSHKSGSDLQATLNNTCGSYLNLTTASMSIPVNTTLMSTSTSFLNKTNYQLLSQCKEVDIDQQQQQQYGNSHRHHNHHHKSGPNYEHNYDSGVSMRSVASIERVSDWLATSNVSVTAPPPPPAAAVAPVTSSSAKTTVAYYLPGEDVAYISSFNGTTLNLAQFKQLITKKGQFRYFFKTKSDLLDEECIVYQEVTDETSTVPMFNNKVIAKIEKF